MSIQIFPSTIEGQCSMPPSKSQSMRALIFAFLSNGLSTVQNILCSPDIDAMLLGIEKMGAKVQREGDKVLIEGVNARPKAPENIIDVGNSGLALRFLTAAASLGSMYTVITGDDSIRQRRVIAPLLKALDAMGAFAVSTRNNGFAPVVVKGPIQPSQIRVRGEDSQVVSALLIASSFLPGKSSITAEHLGERPYIDMTLAWLATRGIEVSEKKDRFTVYGSDNQPAFSYSVPSDFSSLSFIVVGAILSNKKMVVCDLDFQDTQGDKSLITSLQKMGASIKAQGTTLTIYPSKVLEGGVIDAQQMIDAVPILAVLGCFTKKGIILENASICKAKESNRLESISKELTKMGANAVCKEDGLIIYPSDLSGAKLSSCEDHRIAMALAIAAMRAKTPSILDGYDCAKKSFPGFFDTLQHLGAKVTVTS
jgi:3-phosphoshikimate 1-carboxyvinyltransferase